MTKPFFSIITCVYNSEKFLGRNFSSVSKQTFRNYEHVIVYSFSKDKSKEIIREYEKKNKNVVVALAQPEGISPAFNKGIVSSTGKYLFFLNSDDYFYDENVLKDVNLFLRGSTALNWIYGKINVVEEDGKNVGEFPKWKAFQAQWGYLLKFVNFVPHQAVFMKKEVFDKFGPFDESLSSQMDYEYWLRVAGKTKWNFFNRIISNYTIRKGAKSSSKKNSKENLANMEAVQKRYTNRMEFFLAGIIERLVEVYNKTTR